MFVHRILESECKRFKVKLNKPKSVNVFYDALQSLLEVKKKAQNVLLDEVENDIESKEKFITEQIKTLGEMQNNINTLIEHKNVLAITSLVISGAFDENGNEIGNRVDEEAKREPVSVPLQEMPTPEVEPGYTAGINQEEEIK